MLQSDAYKVFSDDNYNILDALDVINKKVKHYHLPSSIVDRATIIGSSGPFISDEEWAAKDENNKHIHHNFKKEDWQVVPMEFIVKYLLFTLPSLKCFSPKQQKVIFEFFQRCKYIPHEDTRQGDSADLDGLIVCGREILLHTEYAHFGKKGKRLIKRLLACEDRAEQLGFKYTANSIKVFIQMGGPRNKQLEKDCKQYGWILIHTEKRICQLTDGDWQHIIITISNLILTSIFKYVLQDVLESESVSDVSIVDGGMEAKTLLSQRKKYLMEVKPTDSGPP